MAYTRHLLSDLNFVLSECTGFVDDQTLLVYLMSLRSETSRLGVIRELVDTRRLRNPDKLTVKGLIRIADKHKAFFLGKRFISAILVNSEENSKIVEFYAGLASSFNLEVKVFQEEIDAALVWLGYEYKERLRLRNFVRQRTSAVKYVEIGPS